MPGNKVVTMGRPRTARIRGRHPAFQLPRRRPVRRQVRRRRRRTGGPARGGALGAQGIPAKPCGWPASASAHGSRCAPPVKLGATALVSIARRSAAAGTLPAQCRRRSPGSGAGRGRRDRRPARGVRLAGGAAAPAPAGAHARHSHFFHRKLMDLRGALKQAVRDWPPPGMTDAPALAALRRWGGARRLAARSRPAGRPGPRSTGSTRPLAPPPARSLAQRLFARDEPAPAPCGLYLWGRRRPQQDLPDRPVLRRPADRRQAPHAFPPLHARGARAPARIAGERDPLAAIAREWRRSLRVLVLDEFFVSDIGDAMLLARLLDRLFAEGVCW